MKLKVDENYLKKQGQGNCDLSYQELVAATNVSIAETPKRKLDGDAGSVQAHVMRTFIQT